VRASGRTAMHWTSVITALLLALFAARIVVTTPLVHKREDEFVLLAHAPVISGRAATLLARLASLPVVGDIIVEAIKRSTRLVSVTTHFSLALRGIEPMHFPVEPLDAQEVAKFAQLARDTFIEIDWSAALQDEPEQDGDGNRLDPYLHTRDYVNAYLAYRDTPTSVMERLLKLLPAFDDRLHAISQLDRDSVLRQAAESTERYRLRQPLSALDGVPIAVKDDLAVVGFMHTRGTNFLPFDRRASAADEEALARLRKTTGAIFFASASMHEIGVGGTGNNPSARTARNPHSMQHHTGGSSSGGAALVAANLVPLAIGTDGGGSVRIPAALCGVVGFKPTFQRFGNVYSASSTTLSSLGVLANSAHDAAVVYLAMAGAATPRGHASALQPPPHLANFTELALAGLRVGVFKPWVEHADAETRTGFDLALRLLRDNGAEIVDDLPVLELGALVKAFTVVFLSEVASLSDTYFHNHTLNAESTLAVLVGRSLSARDYIHAQRIRRHFFRLFRDKVFANQVDVLIFPSTGVLAPALASPSGATDMFDAALTGKLTMFTSFCNLLGLPAGVLPVGYGASSGLPSSVQVVADVWREDRVLRVLRVLEALASGVAPKRQPAVFARSDDIVTPEA